MNADLSSHSSFEEKTPKIHLPPKPTLINGVLEEPAAGDAEQGADGAQQRSVYETRAASTGATQLGASAVGLCKNSNNSSLLSEDAPPPLPLESSNLTQQVHSFSVSFPLALTAFIAALLAFALQLWLML